MTTLTEIHIFPKFKQRRLYNLVQYHKDKVNVKYPRHRKHWEIHRLSFSKIYKVNTNYVRQTVVHQ